MILLAGGDADPNIAHLAARLAERKMLTAVLRVGASGAPRLVWHMDDDLLEIAGSVMVPAAAFLRYDVFTHLQNGRPESRITANRWYYTLLSWAMTHPEVAMLNRRYGARQTLKPYVLQLARQHGLAVPRTVISNDLYRLDDLPDGQEGWIAKPVDGGEYTRTLSDAMASETVRWQMWASPSVIQQRLIGPELRIYRVGGRCFAFEITSKALDYRSSRDVTIKAVAPRDAITQPLIALMEALGLDFGAADFKTCPETGELLFLEVNSMPMFVAFDRAVAGALTDAIFDWLSGRR